MSDFLNPARGVNEKPLYAWLAIWSGFGGWILLGSVVAALFSSLGTGTVISYGQDLLRFALLWAIAWYITRVLGRSPRTLFGAAGTLELRWLRTGFLAWFGLQAGFSLLGFVLSPRDFAFTFNLANLPAAVLIAAVFLPIQTSAEELFFRGLIPQTLSLSTRRTWVVVLCSALLFALPHFANPEVSGQFIWALLAYGALGAAWTYSAIQAGNLGIAIGAHYANNFFGLLIVGYANSALPAYSIWSTPAASMPTAAVGGVIAAALWCYWIRRTTANTG